MSWACLFDRAAEHDASLAAVRDALAERRPETGDPAEEAGDG